MAGLGREGEMRGFWSGCLVSRYNAVYSGGAIVIVSEAV